MNNNKLLIEVKKVINKLVSSEISSYIDSSLTPPDPFRGGGEIKLIVLGQDPTVHNPKHRKKLKVALLLNQPGRLRTYVEDICKGLDIELDENIYATNLLKNFFTAPPDTLRKKNPQLFLTKSEERILIRNFWGYEGPAQYGKNFAYMKPTENILSRVVFPFPHLPGRSHKIYQQQFNNYLAFMKEHINPGG